MMSRRSGKRPTPAPRHFKVAGYSALAIFGIIAAAIYADPRPGGHHKVTLGQDGLSYEVNRPLLAAQAATTPWNPAARTSGKIVLAAEDRGTITGIHLDFRGECPTLDAKSRGDALISNVTHICR